MRKTITIHFEINETLPSDKCCAWVEDGEFAKLVVAADSIGEAVKEVGISIQVMEMHANLLATGKG